MFDPALKIDTQDPLPRHAQVQRILRDMVASGRLKPGDKIPAELQIADALGVSKMTVNKALLALTASGMFVREVGRGTFVAASSSRTAVAAAVTTRGGGKSGASRRTAVAASPGTAALLPPPQTGRRPRLTLSFVEGAKNVLESHYYSTLYQGVIEAVEQGGGPPLADLTLSPLAARNYVAEDASAPADGRLIIAPRAESITSIEALWESGKPLVVVGASWPSMGVPSVDSDNIGGAVEAVRHLTGLGHQRIALLCAEEETANMQDRIVGYRRALSVAGLRHDPEWEVCAEQAWRAGEEAMNRLVALLTAPREPVTAIFAAGHYLSLEALNAARLAGRRVPEEISVVGYDDPLSAQLVYPPLTTIRQPLYEMGKRAAERLLRLVQGAEPGAVIREVLPAQIMVRGSTAAAPHEAIRGETASIS